MVARGGRRSGAGRPTGSGWKPKVKAFRQDAVEKQHAIVGSDDDPLTVVASWVLDPNLDMHFRLSAAGTVLPYLYPRLSASTVDANIAVTKVDSSDLLRRLDERLAKLAAPPPTLDVMPEEPPLTIEVTTPDEED